MMVLAEEGKVPETIATVLVCGSPEGPGEEGIVAEGEVTKQRGIFKLSEFDQT